MNRGDESESGYGILCGIAAYGSWGIVPLYFKTVASVSPVEVLAHRAVWSFIMLAVLVGLLGRWREFWGELHSHKLLLLLASSTLFIGVNWLTFIYAVTNGQVLQASLGYFINPLVNVMFGVLFLRERLRTRQTLSIGLALVGVLVLTVLVGDVPWVALTLAFSFSLYALMRKFMPVDGVMSLTAETLIMAPVGLAYLGYLAAATTREPLGLATMGLLTFSGPITTVPLLFFGAAVRRLRLSTLGILQYLSPSLQFLLAVLAFGEPFSSAQLLSFGCIWAAVLLYALDSLRTTRPSPVAVIEPD